MEKSLARSARNQTQRPADVKPAPGVGNAVDSRRTGGYPDRPRAEGFRAHGHDGNDDQAHIHGRVGLAGHHPGRNRLAARRQVFEGRRRGRRTSSQGRARRSWPESNSLSLSAAPTSRNDGRRRPAVVSGSWFRPLDPAQIPRLAALETAILVPFIAVCPSDCPRTGRESCLSYFSTIDRSGGSRALLLQ